MATGGRANASDIKVWSSGVCLLNSFVCIACTGLLNYLALTGIWAYTTYLCDFLSSVEMSFIWVWIGHECHSWRERNLRLAGPASHMLCRKVTIHYEGSNELIPLKALRMTKNNVLNDDIHSVLLPPISWKIDPRLWTCRAKYGHRSILGGVILILMTKST